MSLRLRLFLLFGALVALLFAGQVWLVESLSRDLSQEVGAVAVSVGQSVVTAVGGETPGAALPPLDGERHIRVFHRGPDDSDATVTSYQFEVKDDEEPGAEPTEINRKHHAMIVRLNADGEQRSLVLEENGSRREIPIPERGLGSEMSRFTQRLLFGTLSLLGLGLVAAAVMAHRVSRPLAELAAAARRVGQGELGAQAPVPKDVEVGETVRAFNQMSCTLLQLEEERRLLRSREHLAEIGEVARGLAHSLRNPLNALGLTVEELATTAPAAEAHELATTARRQIERIDRSLKALLVLTADDSPRLKPERVDLAALIDDVLLEVLQDSRCRATFQVERDEPGELDGVTAELRAMFQALVVNAAEASPEGGIVVVRLMKRGDRAVLEVEDQGAGLAPEVRARLFSPHVSTKATGSGMGLFLCHRLATSRYGGRLELLAAPRGGTLARLELQARQRREDVADA